MGKKIALWLVGIFGGNLGKVLGVGIIAMIPVIELRGSIIVAYAFGLEWYIAMGISIIGNMLPIPFILLFLDAVFKFMKKHNILAKFVIKMEQKAYKNEDKVLKYAFWSLAIFVGIPLPGTGAWTGALIASVIKMNRKKALLSIFIGVVLASIIVTILTYGLIGSIF